MIEELLKHQTKVYNVELTNMEIYNLLESLYQVIETYNEKSYLSKNEQIHLNKMKFRPIIKK